MQTKALLTPELQKKYDSLLSILRSYKTAAVAFSSGVDSTFLVHAAKEALGDEMIAITAVSSSFPQQESEDAKAFCAKLQVRQILVDAEEKQMESFSTNPSNRCYFCKKALFSAMKELAAKEGRSVVMEGSNVDDMGDYRPGMKAIAELDVKSPLKEAGLTKQEIRDLSRYFELPTWNKPSFACLASRFPYGEAITKEKLHMVEKAEQLLMSLGFPQFRVRIHGTLARIELLPEDLPRMMEPKIREKVYNELNGYGFSYVSLDLKGYRTGSMNEVLSAATLNQ